MNVGDFIGFFIALAALLLSSWVRKRQERDRAEHPERYEAEEQERADALRELLESLDMPVEVAPKKPAKKPPPPPKKKPEVPPVPKMPKATSRRVSDSFAFESSIESRHQSTSIEERHLDLQLPDEFDLTELDDEFAEAPQADVWDPRERPSGVSRGNAIMKRKGSLRDLVIASEILGPPKADG